MCNNSINNCLNLDITGASDAGKNWIIKKIVLPKTVIQAHPLKPLNTFQKWLK